MSGSFHFGDSITQYGDHNIGMIKNQGEYRQQALQEMISAVEVLRIHVSGADCDTIDESMKTIRAGDNVENQGFRRALENIASIAKAVGRVGVPVIESVRKVMAAFGL